MVQKLKKNRPKKKLTNAKMFAIIMQEISDVHRELRTDILSLRSELKTDIFSLDQKLSKKIDSLSTEVKGLRFEVHQNQSTFIKNHEDLEKRVAVLEGA